MAPWLAAGADGFGFINARAKRGSGDAGQGEYALAGEAEMGEAVAEIRAEGEAGSHDF